MMPCILISCWRDVTRNVGFAWLKLNQTDETPRLELRISATEGTPGVDVAQCGGGRPLPCLAFLRCGALTCSVHGFRAALGFLLIIFSSASEKMLKLIFTTTKLYWDILDILQTDLQIVFFACLGLLRPLWGSPCIVIFTLLDLSKITFSADLLVALRFKAKL